MTETPLPVPTGPIAPPPTPAPAPGGVPTIDQSIRVDIGSALSTLFHAAEPIAAVLAGFGIKTALAEIPFGSVIVGYATPLIEQYVASAFTALEGALDKLDVNVPAGNVVLAAAANMFNSNEKALAAFLGGALPAMLEAAVKKLGLPITIPGAPAAPATPAAKP